MRCETNHGRGFLVFEQIRDEAFECDLPLRERALIEGCKDLSCFDQGNQLLEEIGRDHLNLPQLTLFFQGLEDRNAVCRTNIQALRGYIALEQRQGLSIGLLGTFMRFEDRKQAERRRKHGKGRSEAAQFLGMIESGELTGDGSDMRLSIELVRE